MSLPAASISSSSSSAILMGRRLASRIHSVMMGGSSSSGGGSSRQPMFTSTSTSMSHPPSSGVFPRTSSRTLRRHFYGSRQLSQRRLFDPLRTSSATVLKQSNEELSREELILKQRLLAYQENNDNNKNNSNNNDDDVQKEEHLLDELQQAYMELGYWQEALGVEAAKCQTYMEAGTDEYADSIHAQGKLWLRQDNFQQSKPLYEQALHYFQDTGNTLQQGHVLISLAGWYYFRNQLDEAMEHLTQAEVLLDANPALLVKCLDNQGLILRLFGEFDQALDKYQQALQVVVDDHTKHALQLHVADMLVALEEPEQALEVYQDLLRQEEPPLEEGMMGVLWHNVATLHVEQGNYDLALEEFRKALHWKQETGGEDHPEVGKTWNSLGALHFGVLDEKIQALDCFRHALWIARIHAEDAQTDPDVLAALQTISDIEQQMEKET